MSKKTIFSKSFFLIFFSILLFLLPFFWLKPGEVDLGGDSSRLYFYDPIHFLQNLCLYVLSPVGFGIEDSYISILPFVSILSLLKIILKSSYLVVSFFNGFTLTTAFLSIYVIINEFLSQNSTKNKRTSVAVIGILVGLLYIFLPLSFSGGWERALIDHTQLFINPLLFWLFLRYIHTSHNRYILFALLISFIFSNNFSYNSSPKFFAFFPLAVLYLILYTYFVRKSKLNFKKIMVFLLLFIGIQSFHILPQLSNLFMQGSNLNSKVFTQDSRNAALSVFAGNISYVTLYSHILGLPSIFTQLKIIPASLFVYPLTIIIGLLLNIKYIRLKREVSLNFLLIFIFFLITLFLFTAKVTNTSIEFYKLLFFIPGFAMFENYEGQFLHIFLFYYVLLLGYSLFYISNILKPIVKQVFYILVATIIFINAVSFINGSIFNSPVPGTVSATSNIIFHKDYEKALEFIRRSDYDGKVLTMPFTDVFYEVVGGINAGIYLGPSPISYLTGKNDFGSSSILEPFTKVLLRDAKEKDIQAFSNILPILNIKHIFLNTNPQIYSTFPAFPYAEMKEFMPHNAKDYQSFIKQLPVSLAAHFGYYRIYTVTENFFLPHIYIAEKIYYYDKKNPGEIINTFDRNTSRSVFVPKDIKDELSISSIPDISFQRINKTKYKITVENAHAPYLLIFSEGFSNNWKLFFTNEHSKQKTNFEYFNGGIKESKHENIFLDKNIFETLSFKEIVSDSHFIANAYANLWYIKPSDTEEKKEYTLILELTSQRWVYIGFALSSISVILLLLWMYLSLKEE